MYSRAKINNRLKLGMILAIIMALASATAVMLLLHTETDNSSAQAAEIVENEGVPADTDSSEGMLTVSGGPYWKFDDSTGTMTIYGDGALPDTRQSWVIDRVDAIKTVIIEGNVTYIGSGNFAYCQNLTTLIIRAPVTGIGGMAFYEDWALTTIDFGDSLEWIGNTAFRTCSALTSLTFPESLKSIGDEAFGRCYTLKSVTFDNSLTLIGNCAFRNVVLLDRWFFRILLQTSVIVHSICVPLLP